MEEALSNASRLSPNNSNVWGWFMMLNFERLNQNQIKKEFLNEIFRIFFEQEKEDLKLLIDIGRKFEAIGEIKSA